MSSLAESVREFRNKLQSGQPLIGLWITIPALAVGEIACEAGLDWVCIDLEHSELDFRDVANHLRMIRGTNTLSLVRIPSIDQGIIQKVLGFGAHGIIVPRIRTPQEVQDAVTFAKYPVLGKRGIGVEKATQWGTDRTLASAANSHILVIPLIETVEAGTNISAILDIPEVDGVFFGPADYSASAGFVGEWEGPGVSDEILRLKDFALSRNRFCGIVATGSDNGVSRIKQGFQMVGLGVDSTLLFRLLIELRNRLSETTTSNAQMA